LFNTTTTETAEQTKARLVEMQRRYRKEKADMRALIPRERGVNFLVEKISKAARNGDISQDAADLAIDLLRKQPGMFSDLAMSITKSPDSKDGVQGWYRSADALIKIFKNPSDATTVVHEILHHTERFLPTSIREKIVAEWSKEVELQIKDIQKKLKNETNPEDRKQLTQALIYLGLAQEMQIEPSYENAESIGKIMSKYLGDHVDSKGVFHEGLGNSWYQLFNPSEWWAVNASRLLKEAKNKPDAKTWVDKVKLFYDNLIDSIKKIFKGSATAAVEKGLKSILNGNALEERVGTQLSGANRLFNAVQEKVETKSETLNIFAKAKALNDARSTEASIAKKRELAQERRKLMEDNPTMKEVDDNIKSINDQLEEAGIIKKTGDCP
jgi:uncharacterized protein (UPF0305 family)